MVEISARYEGGLRCAVTHGPSRSVVLTDAPVDNHGKGEAFSPTDLVAAALATCTLTIMAIYAERHGIDLRGMTASTRKEMNVEGTRRIGSLATVITVPLPADHPHREPMERAAHACPVHRSLDPGVQVPIEFRWTGRPVPCAAVPPG